jgi:regulatory protein YycI of two-component signal transduction system YycFG
MTDLARFQRTVKMVAFYPFTTAENALENINAITEHEMTDDLRSFLESNMSKGKKASKYALGVVSSAKSSLTHIRLCSLNRRAIMFILFNYIQFVLISSFENDPSRKEY